jgi:hypothetical protein
MSFSIFPKYCWGFFLKKKEIRNAITEAHIALMRGSPCVPRTLQMQLKRINSLQ